MVERARMGDGVPDLDYRRTIVAAIVAGVVIALIAGCEIQGPVPPPAPPPVSVMGAAAASRAPPAPVALNVPTDCSGNGINNGNDFASKVHFLSGFKFAENLDDPDYTPPNPGAALKQGDTPPYYEDMAAAWEASPQYLKGALCVLATAKDHGVFIDKDSQTPFAWSFWEVPSNGGVPGQRKGQGRYIAIGAAVWTLPKPFNAQALEELVLNKVLGSGAQGKIFGAVPISPIAPESKSSPTNLALMEMLAREVGLMLYHDYVNRADKLCSGAHFESISWNSTWPIDYTGVIHQLSDEADLVHIKRKHYNQGYTLKNLQSNNGPALLENVYAGLQGPEFADLLAFLTPFNDFAETFRLMMLQASLTSMTLQIPNESPVQILQNLSSKNTFLSQKVSCIEQNLRYWGSP